MVLKLFNKQQPITLFDQGQDYS